MKISWIVPMTVALALAAPLSVVAQTPDGGDVIFTGENPASASAQSSLETIDLMKVDYLLLLEDRDESFDRFHARTMGSFKAEAEKGSQDAVRAVMHLSGTKAQQDEAYEGFLEKAEQLRKLTGVAILDDGSTGPLKEAVAAMSSDQIASVQAVLAETGRFAITVLATRANYKAEAEFFAVQVLKAR